jgi:hypothetical protein
MQTVINQATGAPVNMPDGRVIHVSGMDAAAYKASPEHHSVIVQAAAKSDTTDPAGISNGLTADGGQGSAITNPNTPANPVTGVQTGYNQQVTTQSAGGYIAAGAAAILVLGIIVFFKIKHGHIKAFDAVLVGLLGISLAGTVVGTMGHQITNSLVGSLGGVFGSL